MALALLASLALAAASAANKPHVLFFLADDYGHYDISYNNPKAPTPNLHALASEGVILNRHYVYQYCSPTRSSLMSGRLPIHVNTANNPTTKLGGVDLRMQTIAEALKSAGYHCHTAGKWHAGGHSVGQLPTQRGFDSQLGYLNGMEDHYTQVFNQLKGVDLWLSDAPALGRNGSYGAFMYAQHLVGALAAHDYSTPVFIYAAWQNTHSPLQVPANYLDPSIDTEVKGGATKQSYFGMTKCMDECVGNVTKAHKTHGGAAAWANTLVVFSADNGGETFAGGNNYPWRGGKYTDFEGGTRVAAFISGGLVPPAVRGTLTNTTVHICDWFVTLSNLAGATLPAPHPGVPPMDSLDVWAAITATSPGAAVGPRTEVPLSATALVIGDMKLMLSSGRSNIWCPPDWPVGNSTPAPPCDAEAPCLFDLAQDPHEHVNLAAESSHAPVLAKLQSRMAQLAATVFQTGQDGYTGGFNNCTTLDAFMAANGGFIGPLCTLGGPAPPPPSPGPPTPPPAGGVAISWRGQACLVPAAVQKRGLVSLEACTASLAHGWVVDSEGGPGTLSYAGWKLRPVYPPQVPAACKSGTGLFIGSSRQGKPVGVKLVGDKLVSSACVAQSLCVVGGGKAPVLGLCSSPLASGWNASIMLYNASQLL